MTIRLPPENLLDHFLSKFGIERKIIIPDHDHADPMTQKQNPYVTKKAKRESLFRAILNKITKH